MDGSLIHPVNAPQIVAVPLPIRPVQNRHQDRELELRRAQVAQRKAQRQKRNLELLQGSLSAKRVERQAPWLAGLHRIVDGGLVATGVAAVVLAGLTLHWQNRWGSDYSDLQAAQELEHRVLETTSSLEQFHLLKARKPGALVATRSEDLVFVVQPPSAKDAINHIHRPLRFSIIASGY